MPKLHRAVKLVETRRINDHVELDFGAFTLDATHDEAAGLSAGREYELTLSALEDDDED
jgi:hypothetical protein